MRHLSCPGVNPTSQELLTKSSHFPRFSPHSTFSHVVKTFIARIVWTVASLDSMFLIDRMGFFLHYNRGWWRRRHAPRCYLSALLPSEEHTAIHRKLSGRLSLL